jgi:hypothetical protein
VDSTFVLAVDQLPLEGKAKQPPIPGDYWATYKDSINHRWDGESSLSPAEKIEKALNKPGFAKAVTDDLGIYGHGRKACDNDSECTDLKDGSGCAKPRGATGTKSGRCIPRWWGICHGWAPYAISEPAAVKEVVKNGVTFYPGDLEGLMSAMYGEWLPTKFLSTRCNKKKEDIGFDANGRPRDGECRDMNPGSMHVVTANFLGLRQQGFVEDRTWDLEVWNQPVRSFKVTNAQNGKLKEITKAEAAKLVGLDLTFTVLAPEAEIKKDETKKGLYTATAAGEIVIKISGTNDADLHVRKGQEATDKDYDCRPYEGDSNESCTVAVAAGDKVHWMVKGYAATSKITVSVGSMQGTPNYTYNTNAVRFFHVEMDLSYITESSPARTSHITSVDSYTRTDHYSYILEADANGKILGGEWLGNSHSNHPDFVWWPTGKPQGTVVGKLTYAEIKAINDEAASTTTSTPVGETKELFKDVTVTYSSKYATVGVPGGAKLVVTMTGTGNSDLYVRLGSKPTIYTFTCKSTNADSNETCTVTAPAAGGSYYVRVRPRTEGTISVTATITPAS